MTKIALLCAIALSLSGVAQAAGDAAKGQAKSSTCAGCHEIPGWRNAYPAYREPKLAGQHADYIVSALKAYKSGERQHPTMHAIAASLSDQDMQDLAAYFSRAPQGANQTGGTQK